MAETLDHIVRRRMPAPTFNDFRRWTSVTIRRHYWRVATYLEPEDLWQEAAICYCRCRNAYPRVTHPPHFGALYRTAFLRRLHDLATDASRQPDLLPDAGAEKAVDSLGPTLVLLRQLAAGVEPAFADVCQIVGRLGHRQRLDREALIRSLRLYMSDALLPGRPGE